MDSFLQTRPGEEPAVLTGELSPEDEGKFWMTVREALLLLLDSIERYKTRTTPRTSEIRRQWKADRRGV